MLPLNKKINQGSEYYMADFTNLKQQALFGYTKNNTLVRIVVDEKKEFTYTRYEGTESQLTELGFNMESMVSKNLELPDDIKISNDQIFKLAENVETDQIYLLGGNKTHRVIVLVFDRKGNYQGYSIKD